MQPRFNTQPYDSQSSLERKRSSIFSLSDQLRSSYKYPSINPKLERQNIQALEKFNKAVNGLKLQSEPK